MAWSYDFTQPDVPLNGVRLLIGDTNAAKPLFQDEEIDAFVLASDSTVGAAALAARALAARASRDVDKWVGDLKILASQRHRAYLDMQERLEKQAFGHGMPSAGGIRTSQKEAQTADTDLVTPFFKRGMHDHPR